MESDNKEQMFIGIDIGGTLAKICIWCPKSIKLELPELENLRAQFSKGELIFNKIKVADIDSLLETLKKLKAENSFKTLIVTGGGAFKYNDKLKVCQPLIISKAHKEIDAEYTKESEIGSLLKGFNFIVQNVENYAFYYRKATGPIYMNKKPQYPLVLINIGSGVSTVKFTSPDEYKRIGGTSLGGGTFLGLCNLLIGSNNFDELLELAENGKSENTDLLIRDIYHGQDSPHSNLTSENLAVSLGKLAIDHLRNIKKAKKEDMAKSLLIMIAFNISQLAYYFAKNENIKEVYFAGNFIRQHTLTMECMSYGLSYFSAHNDEDISAIFLKHDGFLGALGCTLGEAEKANYDISSKNE